MDWHGPSAADAWSTADALYTILRDRGIEPVSTALTSWNGWTAPYRDLVERSDKVVVVGHSNGGQGTWYLTSRWPDRVLGGKLDNLP